MVERTRGNSETSAFSPDKLDNFVRIAIAVNVLLLAVLAATKNVNWDEFYFLSHVHAFMDGRLDRPLQTFFVRGFIWLDQVPGHEVEQVIAARYVMIVFVCITAFSIHRIADRLTDTASANVAVLAFLTSGFVLPHGASFRADPMAAALLTSAMALIMTTQMKLYHVLAAAVLCALAVLVTVKSALFAPAFLAGLLWRATDTGVALRILLAGALTLVVFVLLYGWHTSGIIPAAGNETATNLADAASTTLLPSQLFPRAPYIATWAVLSFVPIVLALVGLTAVKSLRLACLLLLLGAPLLSIVIYRNAYPYFFPFAVPLMMVSAAYGAQSLMRTAWASRLVLIMFGTGLLQAGLTFTEGQSAQRATIAEVHRLFPDPVPYIDDSHMIASFPNAGPFMSTWVMQNYRRAGQPVLAPAIAEHQPPLLIANKWTLIAAMEGLGSGHMLPADDRALHDTYVHYNGPIWLAGQAITLGADAQQVTLPFAGNYRIETDASVSIDGQAVVDGDVVMLGTQARIGGAAGTAVKLVWSTGVPPLDRALPTEGLYADFWALVL